MSNLIGEGGYGCVYYPGFNCQGKINDKNINTVSKIVLYDRSALNEIYIGSLIEKIKDYKLFFSPVISDCSINITLIDKKRRDKCTIIDNYGYDTKYLLLTIPYHNNILLEKLFYNNKLSIKEKLLSFVETYKYLINSISYLLNINVVHYDIYQNNILFSNIDQIPIIIDFGLAIPINKINLDYVKQIKQYFYIYSPKNSVWSLEVHILCYYLYKVEAGETLTEVNIKNIINSVIDNNLSLNIFSPEFINKYKKLSILFFNQYIGKSIEEILYIFFDQKLYETWDCYSLSMLYLDFLQDIFKDYFVKNNTIINILKLLLINISPDPSKRYPIDITKQKCKDLFYITDLTKYSFDEDHVAGARERDGGLFKTPTDATQFKGISAATPLMRKPIYPLA